MLSSSVMGRRKFLGGIVAGLCGLPMARLLATSGSPTGGRLSYNSVSISTPHIALTFDDGPHATLTPKLLDTLGSRKVRATFYVIGRNVNANPAVAKRIVDEGHEIANHTWSHPSLSGLSSSRVSSELGRAHEEILKTTGIKTANMRPPYGAVNGRVRQIAKDQFGYPTIMWSVDPLDWKYRNADRVSSQLVAGAAPGAILLCHDIHATTVAAIPRTLDQLLAKGYQFVTVSELLSMDQTA